MNKDNYIYSDYKSFQVLSQKKKPNSLSKTLYILFVIVLGCLFLPWTQNIRSNGRVIALSPEQRPQTIHSIIAGRIESWHVQEGQYVNKGDTIMRISEVKSDYLDPNLLGNTESQLKSKEFAVKSYMEKIRANDDQIDAMIRSQKLKLEQAENKLLQANLKLKSDSVDLIATDINLNIAKDQLARMEDLYEKGLKSLTDLETRRLKLQENQAKYISQQNKLLTTKNELINAQIELQSIRADFRDKIAKSESEKFASLSQMYDAEATVSKLQNQVTNYSIRSGMYAILAPQNGFVTQAIQSGIGETIKEGEEIVSIMPSKYDLAIEMYVYPMDIPLVQKEQKIRIQFDGWPAIVFSGWPGISFGTYGGRVVAIDNFVNASGKYRVLVAPDTNEEKWPVQIRIGAGANALALLKNVSVWYELWRQINGFPPDFYFTDQKMDAKKNEKK